MYFISLSLLSSLSIIIFLSAHSFLHWLFSSLHHLYLWQCCWIPGIKPITAHLPFMIAHCISSIPDQQPSEDSGHAVLDWAWKYILDLGKCSSVGPLTSFFLLLQRMESAQMSSCNLRTELLLDSVLPSSTFTVFHNSYIPSIEAISANLYSFYVLSFITNNALRKAFLLQSERDQRWKILEPSL